MPWGSLLEWALQCDREWQEAIDERRSIERLHAPPPPPPEDSDENAGAIPPCEVCGAPVRSRPVKMRGVGIPKRCLACYHQWTSEASRNTPRRARRQNDQK